MERQEKGKEPATSKSTKTDDELRDIMRALVTDPEKISDLSDEDVIAMKQRINPVGTFAPLQKNFAVLSLLNMKEQDMQQFTMTAMIGFIYRRLEEYMPDYLVCMEEAYAKRINEITTGERVQERRDELREECKKRVATHKKATTTAIRAFLDSIFMFDPDKHIRRAPAELPVDAADIIGATSATGTTGTTGATSTTGTTGATGATSEESQLTAITRDAYQEEARIMREQTEKYRDPAIVAELEKGLTAKAAQEVSRAAVESASIVYRAGSIVSGNLAQGYRIISDEIARMAPSPRQGQLEDTRQLLFKCRSRVEDALKLVGPYATAATSLETVHAMQIAPPADVFYHFGRYIESHYEHLRLLTNVIYRIPPSIENVVIYYDTFTTEPEAREYIRVHEADFRADPKIVENGGVTLLGPFRENRHQVDMYNRNTEVLRIIAEKAFKDQQLGKDITKQRVTRAKKESQRHAGPDDPGLDKYIAARGIVQQFGQKRALTREEREKLTRAEQECAEFEAPDDTLAVRVLAPTLDESGMPVDVEQKFFYTRAANVASSSTSGAGTSATK